MSKVFDFKVGDVVRLKESSGEYLTAGKLARIIKLADSDGDVLVKEINNPYADVSFFIYEKNIELIARDFYKKTKKVFSVNKFVEDCKNRGYDIKRINISVRNWGGDCEGLTEVEMFEIGYLCHEDWLIEMEDNKNE